MCAKKATSPITKEIIIEGLKLFNEKSDVLNRRSFTKIMEEGKFSLKFSFKGLDGGSSSFIDESTGPDEEATHAFVTTFRFFIQDNEKCSLRNLSAYYNSGLIEESLKNRFNEIRDAINSFLAAPGGIHLTIDLGKGPELLTRRRIMEIFTYGGIAHATPGKKEFFDFLMNVPMAQVLTKNEFNLILETMRRGINSITKLNNEALEKLK